MSGISDTGIVAAAVLAVAGALLLIFSAYGVPPMDDTYIHLVFGRNLMLSGQLEFNPGLPSSGATSPLWVALSGPLALTGGQTAVTLLMVLSLIAGTISLLLAGSVYSSLLLLSGPLLFHGPSGMETSLAVLLVVIAWRSVSRSRPPGIGQGLLLAAMLITRPELCVIAIPLLFSAGRPDLAQTAKVLLPPAVVGILWVSWNVWASGCPLPSSFYAKQAGAVGFGLLAGLRGLCREMVIVSPLLGVTGLAGIYHLLRRKCPLGLFSLVPLTSLLLQPNSFFQMRYHVPGLVVLGLCAAGVSCSWKRWMRILIVLSLLPGLLVFGSRRVRASANVLSIDTRPALYLAEIAGQGDTVAAADVGAPGWLTDLYVIDLDGLVTPERNPCRRVRGWSWIRERADYLLAFPEQYSDLLRNARPDLVHLRSFETEDNVICGESRVGLWDVLP
ncbi:hypothetical protein GF402_04995 [Candidatus Fermentibacteria bacterium]|nr:hypothetical protein [Candidatus Fermentibacteria bacterium]